MRIVVLGAGLMGRAVVYDLARTPDVREIVVGDFDRDCGIEVARAFGRGKAHARCVDIRQTQSLARILHGCNVVVNCTQYTWNIEVMRAALAARVNYVDLGGLYHTTRKQLSLDRDFRRIGRLAILGLGSAPGVTNVMARALCDSLERVESIRIYNAGADQQRYDGAVAYTFSIATILDELTIPPVHFLNGRYLEKPILSDPEPGNFAKPIGHVVLRHSIHSEVATLAESFRDRGVREVFFKINYPAELVTLVHSLSNAGLASRDPVAVNGFTVRPRDVLLAVLRKNVPTKPAKDMEAIRVVVTGRRKSMRSVLAMEMWASYTARPQFSAIARDTGFPAAIVAVMLGRHQIQGIGVQAPEKVVPPEPFFTELKKRGIRFRKWNMKPSAGVR